MYFTEYKLAIEVNEKYHTDRLKTKEEREKKTKEYLRCKIIRINTDAEEFDIFVEISRIHNHITESTKKNLIDKILNQSV